MSVPNQPGPSPQPAGGGIRKSAPWILLVFTLALLLGLCCFCGGFTYLARRASTGIRGTVGGELRRTQLALALRAAQQAVLSDPQVIDRLGPPIQIVTPPAAQGKGATRPAGETFQFDIRGPKGTGKVSGVATTQGGSVQISKLSVTFEDGSVVDVSPRAVFPFGEGQPRQP